MNPPLAGREAGLLGNASTRTAGVAAGSVWETRMLNDQVMGGIKLFAAGDAEGTEREEEDTGLGGEFGDPFVRPSSSSGAASERRKRRSWRSPDPEGRTLADILRGAPLPAEGDANAVEEELDTPSKKTWVVEEIKQVDRVRDVPAYPSRERKPPSPPPLEAAMDYPSVRPAEPEIETKSTAIELQRESDFFCDSALDERNDMMQNIVDLLMWIDISRSGFVFAVGAFLLFCTSYAKELDFSLISGVSLVCLLNLAAAFIYKSIICRETDFDDGDQKWSIGEEQAVRFTRTVLPYLNKLLGKLRTLFSGDPATTLKLALMLFILARYGGQITVWTMAKMAFFGAFTIPRFCRSRSTPMFAYGKAWVHRVRHVLDSCTHQKAAAAALFLLLWNFSSMAVRIWASFMLVVVLRYYQQQRPPPRRVAESHSDSEDAQVTIKKRQLAQQRPPSKVAASLPPPPAEAAASGQHRPRRHGPASSASLRPVEAASAKVARKRV